MTLPELFNAPLRGRKDEAALEFQGRTFTFAEIDVRSNRLARIFASRGPRPNDRLCVYLVKFEAAVVGRADPVRGEVPVAYVVL